MLLIPTIFVFVFFGKYILLLFGTNYSLEGFRLLQLLAFSGIFISAKSIYLAVLNVKKQIKKLVLVNLIVSAITLVLCYYLISYGLVGVGFGWLIGQASIILFILFRGK